MRCCADVTFAVIFQAWAVTVNAITKKDVQVDNGGIRATLCRRKEKSVRGLLVPHYPKSRLWNDAWPPVELLQRWRNEASSDDDVSSVPLATAVQRALALIEESPQPGFCYTSRSLQIGSCNELAGL